jgi:hypothetical protein
VASTILGHEQCLVFRRREAVLRFQPVTASDMTPDPSQGVEEGGQSLGV